MKAKTKNKLKLHLHDIVKEFNLILADKGLEELTIQNFKVDQKATRRECQNWKCIQVGNTCYMKCMD